MCTPGRKEVSRGTSPPGFPTRPAHLAPSVWGSYRRKLGGPGTGDTHVAILYLPLARWWRRALEPKHSATSTPSSVGQGILPGPQPSDPGLLWEEERWLGADWAWLESKSDSPTDRCFLGEREAAFTR